MATLIGGTGNDNLIGTFDDDVIDNGGGGSDTLEGGQGDDIIRFSGSVPVGNLAYSQIDGSIGHDILDLTGFQGQMLTRFVNGELDLYEWETGKDGKPTFTDIAHVAGIEEVHLGAGVTAFDVSGVSGESIVQAGWTIVGGNEADQIIGGVGADTIDAGAGNDMVTFNGGSDRIALGVGDDELFYAASSVFSGHTQIDGGAGTDSLFVFPDATLHSPAISIDLVAGTGQVGNDGLTITGIENVQIGQGGDIAAHASSIFVGGSDGANQIMVSGADQAVVLGRDGDDSIQTFSLGGTLIAYGGAGNDIVVGGAGADWINGDGQYPGDTSPGNSSNGGADQLFGEDGNDHIFGNSQAAIQGSVDGNDSIYAGSGMDYVNGNAGNDYIRGEDGSDRLYGGAGDDVIMGDAGNDHINGNKGADQLYGGDGNDEILGGQGNDLLDGRAGYDTLSGNADADTFQMAGSVFTTTGPDAGRTDVITDFQHGLDTLPTGGEVDGVLHPGAAANFTAALALATSVLPASGNDVAAVQVGADTYLFFDSAGHAPDQAVLLLNTNAATLDTHDIV